MNEIAIDDIYTLLNKPKKEYLIVVFGGKSLPKYDSLIYCHDNNIYNLNRDVRERFEYHLDKNELEGFIKYLRFSLSTNNYQEIELKVLKETLEDLKSMGYEKLEYVEL